MSEPFTWPAVLWGLLLVPLLAVLYRAALRRGSRHPIGFPHVALAEAAAAHARPARRHASAALFLLGVAFLLLAAARPRAPVLVAADRSTIILSMDVSGSMRSEDIKPSRLAAAQAAAKAFLTTTPPTVRVGLVTFAGFAALIVPPTTDRQRIMEEIDRLTFARRTAIGEGLLEAVVALPERVRPGPDGALPALPPGKRPPGVVILMSDGRNNSGIDPLLAASIARRQDVTVYTVGVGSPVNSSSYWTIGGSLDEETLQAIARETGGSYFHASTARGLSEVYRRLARTVGWERRIDEVTSAAGMVGGLVILASLIVSRLLTHPLG
jgi:Ca-activated chloride channel family protein